jgi:hypothetical protein
VIAQAPGPAAAGGQGAETPQQLGAEEAGLAKQLANPVASLISVPFQFNFDRGIGVQENIQRANLNIQPVVPFKLSADWNLISRTILPLVNYFGSAGSETGQLNIGDTVQSLFFSPARPGPGAEPDRAIPRAGLGRDSGQPGCSGWKINVIPAENQISHLYRYYHDIR